MFRTPDNQNRVDYNPVTTLGECEKVGLYLNRCQVDTPDAVVKEVWRHIAKRRRKIGKVVDFGAGDARFARYGTFESYQGFEIDSARCVEKLPRNAELINACAFSQTITDASICTGNPPYVRNQDMPEGWRERAAAIIEKRSGVKLSGLANAWQYFFYLSLLTANAKGLVALVIPFEWVSRPSSKLLREYIKDKGWRVSVYRLRDSTFDRVLTTSSITIIDKRHDDAVWEFFQYDNLDEFSPLKFATGTGASVLEYKRRKRTEIHAKRGLSPGTQEALVLTEGERVSNGLIRGIDVVPCVTTLRPLMNDAHSLTVNVFSKAYVDAGKRCWLIRTDRKPSKQLMTYLNSVPATMHDTSTCSGREDWWRFTMPTQPAILCATGFRDRAPKVVSNLAGAMAVGGVCGIYGIPQYRIAKFRNAIAAHNFGRRVVSHSNGLRKIEINQMNAVLVGIEKKQKKNL